MIDIFDMIHYLIGLIILGLLLGLLIKTHNYFSKDNKAIGNQTIAKILATGPTPSVLTKF
jgi:hypothetical protein